MRHMAHAVWDRPWVALAVATTLTATAIVPTTAAQTTTKKPASPAPADIAADATVEELFKDFIHYAQLGMYTASNAYGKALLAHRDLDPVVVMEAAHRDPKAIDTVVLVIGSARDEEFRQTAAQVMELIHQGEFKRRHDPERIAANIRLLGGNPQQEAMAIAWLRDAGEYAVPPLIKMLLNPHEQGLRVRILNALPQIGKGAVNPLVLALNMNDENIRQDVIRALGKIGYPQAIPYLRKVESDPKAHPATKDDAKTAVASIENTVGRSFPGATEDLFFELAERYFDEEEDVRADPRLDEANVWYWDSANQELKAVVVPRIIFGQIMAMRCAEEAILIRSDHTDAIGLWLASNVRREDRLGLDVESGDPTEPGQQDATRPAVFPRALYFSQAAGPRYSLEVLERAVRRRDSAVALGAIAALRTTTGAASLAGNELAQCLRFPDLVVRIKAALALGAALPKKPFQDAQFVVPTLAQALSQTGRQQVIVVDANQENANRVTAVLRANDRDVVTDTSFFRALEKARAELQSVSGIFLSTDLSEPDTKEALERLRGEFAFAKTPVVLLVKPGQSVMAEDLSRSDGFTETVNAAGVDAAIEAALERVRGRSAQLALPANEALELAQQAADTLLRIAADGRTVFEVDAAALALIAVLSGSDEKLQKTSAAVLALIGSPAAQRAIAHVALDEKTPKTLRVTAFASLADSAKNHGNMLEEDHVARLVKTAMEEADLITRTAATQALGAVNAGKAGEIIKTYHGG